MIPSMDSPAPTPCELMAELISFNFQISKASAGLDADEIIAVLKDAGYEITRPTPSASLTWTTAKPTLPGWYWMSHEPGSQSIDLVAINNGRMEWFVADKKKWEPIPDRNGFEWSGPIPEPHPQQGREAK